MTELSAMPDPQTAVAEAREAVDNALVGLALSQSGTGRTREFSVAYEALDAFEAAVRASERREVEGRSQHWSKRHGG